MSQTKTIRLGTRGSALARWQTDSVQGLLSRAHPKLTFEVQIITTHGDRVLDRSLSAIGGKGVFTAELEAALREGQIDLAVHSLKDLPTENPPGLTIGAIPKRAACEDVLVSQGGYTFLTLPQDATVGTSSRRRAAQLLHARPDLKIADIRGNVDTRIRKALDPQGQYDAILLAAAGLERLGQDAVITERLALEVMLPAPGQGALGIQCRDDASSRTLLATINDAETEMAVVAERAFLAGLGGGCSLPIAAYSQVEGGTLRLRGRVTAPDGSQQVDVEITGSADKISAQALGSELAQRALGQGAAKLLEDVP